MRGAACAENKPPAPEQDNSCVGRGPLRGAHVRPPRPPPVPGARPAQVSDHWMAGEGLGGMVWFFTMASSLFSGYSVSGGWVGGLGAWARSRV